MTDLPRDARPDATLSLLRDPYRMISETAAGLGGTAYRTRLLGETAVCLTGREGAALFYDTELFARDGAIPKPVKHVLFGDGGIQGLDGAAHRHRKAMFLQIMRGAPVDRFAERLEAAGAAMLPDLAAGHATLLDASAQILARASFDWAGIPVPEADLPRRARQMTTCVDEAGTAGPGYLKGLAARRRLDRWTRATIAGVRSGAIAAPEGSPLDVIARWRDEAGDPLPEPVAATELNNATRPAVAVCWLVVHCAHALTTRPGLAPRVGADAAFRHGFVQEVRRLYPFAPLLAARARKGFDWRGHRFEAGDLVVIDLYGTSRGPHWEDPDAFRPERHLGSEPGPFDMIPQGGGGHEAGHRCPGEWITIRAMEIWSRWLAGPLTVAAGDDPSYDMGTFPALPRDEFRLAGWDEAAVRGEGSATTELAGPGGPRRRA
jgi:fatty-acid peroxygenase